MDDDIRTQIKNNMMLKETEELLEIWQTGDTDEWEDGVFEIIKKILLERLGYVPAQSSHTKVTLILSNVEKYYQSGQLNQALSECDLAIQTAPDNAIAYNYRGLINDELGQRENALADFQAALRLDPEMEDARDNLISIEKEIEEEFQDSESILHLDLALDYVNNNEPEKAMEECELAQSTLPNIAAAHNYLGNIFKEIGQLEAAVNAYQNAVRFNPRYYPARENLTIVRYKLEEEAYRQGAIPEERENQEEQEFIAETDEFPDIPASDGENPVPGWVYLDEKAIRLTGWAGHRILPGRSGYDPLDSDFEEAHMEGVIFRALIDKKMRTRNPIYLLFMSIVGLYLCIPLLWLVVFVISQGDWYNVWILILCSPYSIAGIAMLNNVYLSLQLEESDEYDEKGHVFY